MAGTRKKRHLFIRDKLRLAITNTCNLTCFYCHNEGQEHDRGAIFMSLSFVKQLVRWIRYKNIYVDAISITGGEPLLHPSLLDIVRMLKKVTPNISLNTNAVMLTGPMIDMLADAGVTSLKIGIDSLNHNETKPNITQSHFAGSKLVREIIEHANAKMDVTLNVVITQWNRQKLGSMVEFAAEANIRRVKMIELHDFDSRGMNDQMHRNFRTNSGRDVFQESLKRWTEKSKKKVEVVEKPELGLTTVYILEDDVTIWFYEDPCRTRSCGSMYTEIDAEGSLMVCPRYHIHSKTFASYEPDEEWFELFEAYQKMRCSEQNGTFEEEYRRQSAVCKEYPNAGRRHDDRGNGFYTEKLEKACHKV